MRSDHPNLAQIQSNHGVVLDALARTSDDPTSARLYGEEAVRLTSQAVKVTPLQYSEYPGRLLNFAAASVTSARITGSDAVLDGPLDLCTAFQSQVSQETPDTLVELARAQLLRCRYELGNGSESAAGAVEAYQYVARDGQQGTIRRLNAACLGADVATRSGAVGPAMTLYVMALDLLDDAAWRGIHRRDQERLLADYGRLPSNAAGMALTAGMPEAAVEFLERGRGVLLDRLMDDSADLALLAEADPGLAQRFEAIRRKLDSIDLPDVEADILDRPARPPEQASEADERSALARQSDQLIKEIRATPGCGGLFQAPTFADLRPGIGVRSAVVINISDYRCDAISITPTGLVVTPLPDLTRHEAEDEAEFFRDHAANAALTNRTGWNARQQLIATLGWLWRAIAEPVLRDLAITGEAAEPGEAPHLYWCPTGPAVFLPIHAAGHHADVKTSPPRTVIDRVESSYIPKLRVLSWRFPDGDRPGPTEGGERPLVVSMPTTPGLPALPGAQDEADFLLALFPDGSHLSATAATRDAVLSALTSHTWYHFSVHGVADEHTPTNGGLVLPDDRLTIRDISEMRIVGARFTFLSACGTYRGARMIPDEVVTLGGAFLLAGCSDVVATLWPVQDNYTTEITKRLYGQLVTVEGRATRFNPTDSAKGLRAVARALRDAHPDHPEHWAAFVHITSR